MSAIFIEITKNNRFYLVEKREHLQFLDSSSIKKEMVISLDPKITNSLESLSIEIDDFLKSLAYWSLCQLGRIKENVNQYGLLRRKLFHAGIWRYVKNLANSIAAKLRKIM